jgi:hypothetical protein
LSWRVERDIAVSPFWAGQVAEAADGPAARRALGRHDGPHRLRRGAENMADPTNQVLAEEMADLFRDYEDVWNSQDFGRLKEFWDGDDPAPMYLAEEQDDWRVGWEGVERYWVVNPGKPSYIDAILMRYRVSDAKFLAADLVQVIGWLRHDMKLVGPMKAWGGDCRFTAVLRRRDEGWKLVSYVEAHMTPLTYVQKLYEMNVSSEFVGFHLEVVARRASEAASTT